VLEGRTGRRHELLRGQATLDGRVGERSGRVRGALMFPIVRQGKLGGEGAM
jgi:hypothetical protein